MTRAPGDPPAVTVAYIGGMGRSGSTLLARVLGRVPGVFQVGEICYLWNQSILRDRLCSCGRVFSECPFWRQVGDSAFGGWDRDLAQSADRLRRRVERNRNLLPLALGRRNPTGAAGSFAADVAEYRSLMTQVFAAVGNVSGASVIVDNSKLPSSAYLLRSAPGIDLRVLHLIRSSHGVSYSWAKELSRADFDGRPMRRFSPVRSAGEWLAYNAAFDALAALGVPRLLLRYEDFVAAPRQWTRSALAFLDVAVTDDALAFLGPDWVELETDHGLWGNPMRVRVGRQALRVDDAWRTGLPRRDRAAVTALTLPGLVKYGYAGRRRKAVNAPS
jgi:hypothetical protein